MGTRLIALDLDGTLLNEKMHVSEKTRQVMELCAQRGIEIVPATGRALPAVPEEVLSLPGVHYGIFTNGAVVRGFGKNTWVSESCLSWEETIRVIEVLRRHPVIYDMYVSEGGVSEMRLLAQLEEYGIPERECAYIRATRRAVTDMVEYLREKKCPVQKMNLNFKDRESKQAVRAKLEAMPEVLVTSSLPWNLELNAAGITKGSGLRNLCQYLEIEAEETMAFGDGENDWPMLERGDGKWRPIFKGTRRPDCRFEPGRGRSGGDQTMGAYIKENWLFVVVAVYLVSMVLYGHYRGFVRLAVSAVSLVLSLGVVHFGAPSVANLLRSNEVVYQAVEDSVTKFIQKDDEAENEAADAAPPSVQRSIIEEMELPEQLKDALLENNNSEVYEALGVSSFTHYVSRYLANSLINIISFFLLFAAVFGGLRVLSVSLNVVSRLPIISGLNRLAGAVLGGAEGIFFVWIAALLITLFSATAIGELFLNQIESNIWLTWLYDHNMLGSILMGVVKRII